MPKATKNATDVTKATDANRPSRLTPPSHGFIPQHGGYEKLFSYPKTQIIYDATVRFCDRFISQRSRTHDQMVQAARSGNKNIAEGSRISGSSKKSEIKLTNVARASLEELLGDYQDYLRQAWP
jgi:23S rRNA-intervening sequence protein